MIEAVADAGVHSADRRRRRQLDRRHPRAAQRRRRQGQHQHGGRARTRSCSTRRRRATARSASSPRSTPSSTRVGRVAGLHPRRPHADRHRRRGSGRARSRRCGAGEILLTSMDRDGARTGFDLALTRAVVDAVDVPVIASGGVGSLARPGRRHQRRRRRRRAGRVDLPLRRVHDRAGEGGDGARRASRCARSSRAHPAHEPRSTRDWLDAGALERRRPGRRHRAGRRHAARC